MKKEHQGRMRFEKTAEGCFLEFFSYANTIPQIFWIAYPDGTISIFNKRWFEVTGLSEEEVARIGMDKLLHPEDLRIFIDSWNRSIHERIKFELTYRIMDKSGEYKWHKACAGPVINKEEIVTFWLGVSIDINEEKRHSLKLESRIADMSLHINKLMMEFIQIKKDYDKKEDEILHLQKKLNNLHQNKNNLERITKDQENFSYIITHDLKAPVSNLEALISTLKETDISEEEKYKAFHLVDSCLKNLKQKIEEVREVMEPKSTNEIFLKDVLNEIKPLLANQIKEADVEIIEDFRRAPFVKFSKKNINTILLNLITNSIKYRDPNKKPIIEICSFNHSHYFVLQVKDNGKGMELSKNNIFSKFTRIDTDVEGTGIGLFIVKKIVDEAHGKIEVESEPGKGSIFSIHLKKNSR